MNSKIRTAKNQRSGDASIINSITYSRHFTEDRGHRGIGKNVIEMALRYGDYEYCNKAKGYYFSDRSLRKMKDDGIEQNQIDSYDKRRNIRIIISMDGNVITAMYANNSRCRVNRKTQGWKRK